MQNIMPVSLAHWNVQILNTAVENKIYSSETDQILSTEPGIYSETDHIQITKPEIYSALSDSKHRAWDLWQNWSHSKHRAWNL